MWLSQRELLYAFLNMLFYNKTFVKQRFGNDGSFQPAILAVSGVNQNDTYGGVWGGFAPEKMGIEGYTRWSQCFDPERSV